MSRVELFERIRRDREFGDLSLHALARKYGVHRRTVRQALESPLPPERKRPEGRSAPALGPYREWIDQILIADWTAPRKQRHMAKRIADRLAEEHGVVVAGSTMRDHVRKRRRELGLAAEAFCPQVHDPGVTAEVDWGEATVRLAGVLTVLGLFLMRSCFSGACFVMAFESQCQQAFFEGHLHALNCSAQERLKRSVHRTSGTLDRRERLAFQPVVLSGKRRPTWPTISARRSVRRRGGDQVDPC